MIVGDLQYKLRVAFRFSSLSSFASLIFLCLLAFLLDSDSGTFPRTFSNFNHHHSASPHSIFTMRLGKLTIISVLSMGTALATPISADVSVSPYPQCGYTRFNADDLYMVGVYSSSKCETIWKGQRPGYYRIDRSNCHCQFYEYELLSLNGYLAEDLWH